MKSAYTNKISRNSLCPCNSGKKYKKCCSNNMNSNITLNQSDKNTAIKNANQFLQLGQYNKAYNLCQAVLKEDQNNIVVLQLLGNILMHARRYDDAVNALEKVLMLKPDQAGIYNQLGSIRKMQQRINEGIDYLSKAISINPKYTEAYCNRASSLGLQGRIDEAILDYRKALSLNPEFELAQISLLFMLNFSLASTDTDILEEHRAFGKILEQRFPLQAEQGLESQLNNGRLRIGYLSPDFYTHSVAYFLAPVLESHSRSKFEIFAYYSNSINDEYTKKMKEHCDHWREVRAMSDQAIEDLIRKDKIDILVDLSGYTANNRIQVFARKPAPVQIAWIGYPNTTGLSRMDYRLTDIYADPVGAEELYTEKLYRLPGNFSVYQPPQKCPDVVEPPCVESGQITFGSFNNFAKTNLNVIRLWSRILTEIKNSRLLLKNIALGDNEMRERVCKDFLGFGIEKDRLILLGNDPQKHTHFERYGQVDIGLDPFPYNGTTTTCEALWMGVPVITLAGSSHRARVGVSLLTNLGRLEWVAETADEYVSLAKQLASNYEALKNLRMEQRSIMTASPLMDAKSFTLNLEKAFENIWEKRCEKRHLPRLE